MVVDDLTLEEPVVHGEQQTDWSCEIQQSLLSHAIMCPVFLWTPIGLAVSQTRVWPLCPRRRGFTRQARCANVALLA